MTMIHSKNIAPTIPNANTACQLWQILRCSSHASVCTVCPVGWGFAPNTNKLQFELTDPDGPQSCTETTMSPTIQRMKRMKPPIMTIEGSRRRWKMSQRRRMMNATTRAETVM
jgi:hypothetical protein